jgi:hypothetical protein
MGTLAPAVRDLVERYVAAVQELGVDPERVILFGSHARGTAGPWSDVDLLVVSRDVDRIPPPERPWFRARARKRVNAPVHAIWVTPDQLAAATPTTFIGEILRTGTDVR